MLHLQCRKISRAGMGTGTAFLVVKINIAEVKAMIIVLRFGEKKGKIYKCCVCSEKFKMVKDDFYIDKEMMEEYHICNECLKLEGIKSKINEMVKFYRDDLSKHPRIIDKIIAYVDRDSFSYVVVKAWSKAHNDIRTNVDKEQERRKKFIEVKISN